jgi:predicted nucleic acid-binding protein
MPLLTHLADTNAVSDFLRGESSVREWFAAHPGAVGISTITMAELRRGIELKPEGKARLALERHYRFILEDYRGAIFIFDEAAAFEWGSMMARMKTKLPPYDDSLIGAIARSCAMKVVTRNGEHFLGCDTVNPWDGTERAAQF